MAALMREHASAGGHSTPSAMGLGGVAGDTRDSLEAYRMGKLAELCFWGLLQERGMERAVEHTPFRDDYRVKHPLDDFVVAGVRLDVKGKWRNHDPRPQWAVNLGTLSFEEDVAYVWIDFNRAKGEALTLTGWLWGRDIPARGRRVYPGTPAAHNFRYSVPQWEIGIEKLNPPESLWGELARGRAKPTRRGRFEEVSLVGGAL